MDELEYQWLQYQEEIRAQQRYEEEQYRQYYEEQMYLEEIEQFPLFHWKETCRPTPKPV